jgi:hypothetical protein
VRSVVLMEVLWVFYSVRLCSFFSGDGLSS